jgi:hypothetical protein
MLFLFHEDRGSWFLWKITSFFPCLINPLNAELNPICHLLVLLGDLTVMGPCIVSIFKYTCISNKMQRYTVYLYLETALHVSGGTSTQHQERIQLYLQHLVFVTPLQLSAAIVEELEPVWVWCGWLTPPTAHSNLCNVASWWIYIGILLGAHPILHIGRIRVKGQSAAKGQTYRHVQLQIKHGLYWRFIVYKNYRPWNCFLQRMYFHSVVWNTRIIICWWGVLTLIVQRTGSQNYIRITSYVRHTPVVHSAADPYCKVKTIRSGINLRRLHSIECFVLWSYKEL